MTWLTFREFQPTGAGGPHAVLEYQGMMLILHEGESVQLEKPADPSKKVSVSDMPERCENCRVVGGHLPDCPLREGGSGMPGIKALEDFAGGHDHKEYRCNVDCPAFDQRVYDTGHVEGESSRDADRQILDERASDEDEVARLAATSLDRPDVVEAMQRLRDRLGPPLPSQFDLRLTALDRAIQCAVLGTDILETAETFYGYLKGES